VEICCVVRQLDKTNNKMETIIVNKNIYSLKAIFSAAYIFLEDLYFFLEEGNDGNILIQIKAKDENFDLKKAVDDFKNELINSGLRLKISEDNKNIREMIVSTALYGRVQENKDPKGICKTWEEGHFQDKKIDDPKGICKTWEESHAEKGRSCLNGGDMHKAVNSGVCRKNEQVYMKMFDHEKQDEK